MEENIVLNVVQLSKLKKRRGNRGIAIPLKLPNTNCGKKIAIGAIVFVIGGWIISRFVVTVDKPCDWCSNRPSIAYKTSDGSYAYVCRKCSKTCKLCGEKADRHYENLIGTMVFVCDDCYKGLQ